MCGFSSLQEINSVSPELGIDIVVGYGNKGYAQEAIRLMMEYAEANYMVEQFKWRALNINKRSQNLATKFGGVLHHKEAVMSEEKIERFIKAGVFKSKEDAIHILVFYIPLNGGYIMKEVPLKEAQLKELIKKTHGSLMLVKGITREEMAKALFDLDNEYNGRLFSSAKSEESIEEDLSPIETEKFLDRLIEIQYELFDSKHYNQLKNNLKDKFSESSFYEHLNQCFLAYENDLYYSCVCGLLPFLERVLIENISDPKYEWKKLESEFKNKYKPYLKSDIENDLAEYNIRVVVDNLVKYIEFNKGEPNCLNRHWLLHGRANRMPTKADCLRLFNIIEVIVDIQAEHGKKML